MKALTVQQPWAQCIAEDRRIGSVPKRCENRGRSIAYRGEVAIHAGERWSARGAHDWRVQQLLWNGTNLDSGTTGFLALGHALGVVIAVASITGCHEARLDPSYLESIDDAAACCWPWGDLTYRDKRCWHIRLDDIRPLPEPVSAKGALGLWTLPDLVEADVRAQLAVGA